MNAREGSEAPELCETPREQSDTVSVLRRQYNSDATILLVGLFGAGKKTLGMIASVALRRRFIDFDAFFQQDVHSSPQEFIARHGLARYREIELAISRKLLTENDKACVIVGLGGSASRSQQRLLVDFAQQHPVIYVRRDKSDLQQLAGLGQEKFDRIYHVGQTFFESCSNFDFFNHTQGQPLQDDSMPTYLKLKETERVFVTFLHRIFGTTQRPVLSADPFSSSHTYALQVPLAWLDEPGQDLEVLEAGADAISLVIGSDCTQVSNLAGQLARHIATLRQHCRVPIIVDVTASSIQVNTKLYLEVLERVVRLAPDAVTCSFQHGDDIITRLSASKGCAKVIATFHEPMPVGSSRKSSPATIQTRLRAHQFDAIRFTGEPTNPDDNLGCVSFQHNLRSMMQKPVITYNTGKLGKASVCLNQTLSPVVLPSMSSTGITVQEAQEALTTCFLQSKKIFTIFGQSVKHALSPAMHNSAYVACGLPHSYNVMQSDNLSDVHQLLADENHGGVAISLPYKSAILSLLDEISPEARDMNAVNTVVLEHKYQADGNRNTISKGYNTDYIGIRDCIDKHLSPANAVRDGTTALIVGAGGMARAAVYACFNLGVRRMCIYNRTPEHAQNLAEYFYQWARSKPGTNLRLEVLASTDSSWPTGLRLPMIVVSCIPPFEVGSETPVNVQIAEQWLDSRTGGVFVEV